jgi:hypothetical protein
MEPMICLADSIAPALKIVGFDTNGLFYPWTMVHGGLLFQSGLFFPCCCYSTAATVLVKLFAPAEKK